MKPYNALIVVFVLAACSGNYKPEAVEADSPVSDTAYFALDLEVAKRYTENFRNATKTLFEKCLKQDTVPISSYTIRSVDLLEAMGVSKNTKVKYDYVRVYLGMDETSQFRILLTPVVGADFKAGKAGKDIILSGPHRGNIFGSGVDQASDGEYVLDFNMPCPNTCDEGSELNH